MDPNAACICVDAGEREWRYGWADDEGSQGVEVATGLAFAEAGPSEWRNSLASAFEVLEATPAEHPCLISERPGTTAEERAAMAQVLFDHFHVPAVWFVASPLAALYNAGKDTCVLVDVGERATFVLPVYCGHAAIDAATILPLGGGSLEDSGPEASCDGLFEPSVVGTGAAALCGVHEAVLRTVALCDASVRGALLGNIVLVGGGTRLRDFPERLLAELKSSLHEASAPWTPCVIANADRRISAWMGGSLLCGVPSVHTRFVSRDEFAAEPSLLHARAASLACRDLDEQIHAHKEQRRAEAEAQEISRRQIAGQCASLASAAREWWQREAPAAGSVERDRQRLLQRGVVLGLYDRVLRRDLFGLAEGGGGTASAVDDTGSSGAGGSAGRAGGAISLVGEGPRSGGDDEGAVHDDERASTSGSQLTQMAQRQPARQTAAVLTLVADAMRVMLSDDHDASDEELMAMLRHRLHVRWTVSEMNRQGGEVDARTDTHCRGVEQRRGWSRWRRLARLRKETKRQLRLGEAAWRATTARGGMGRWRAYWVAREEQGARMVSAASAHLVSRFFAWRARLRALARASRALEDAARMGRPVAVRRVLELWRHGAHVQAARLWQLTVADGCLKSRVLFALRDAVATRQSAGVNRITADLVAWDSLRARFWEGLQASVAASHVKAQLAVVAELARRRLVWRALLTRLGEDIYARRVANRGRSARVRANRNRRALVRVVEAWYAQAAAGVAAAELQQRLLHRRLSSIFGSWKSNAHLARVVWRVKMRRTAARLRRGLGGEEARKKRRGLGAFARNRSDALLVRRAEETRASLERHRHERKLGAHFKYWCAEASWRKQRQKWMKRQVRYMHELQNVLDQAGDGQRLARRLLSIGVQAPQRGSAPWSEETLRAGRVAIKRSNAALERALRRESRGGDEATLDHLRVLAPGVDSYLADVL